MRSAQRAHAVLLFPCDILRPSSVVHRSPLLRRHAMRTAPTALCIVSRCSPSHVHWPLRRCVTRLSKA